jgi:hypothetical protein
MDIASAMQVEGGASLAAQAIKDSTGAQLIAKTLDKLHAAQGRPAGITAVDTDYRFQKDVLNAYGIGNKLDTEV